MTGGTRPAVFLDRDGTVIEHVHYLADPAGVRLIPGAAGALRRLREAGYALVIVSNQSAVGRGMITAEQVGLVNQEMGRQLLAEGVTLDGAYHCPEVPGSDDPTVVTHHDRKPGPGMLLRASAELGLDPAGSWMVGDMVSDALAGSNAGCRGSLIVGTGKPPGQDGPGLGYQVVRDLPAAADRILDEPGDRA